MVSENLCKKNILLYVLIVNVLFILGCNNKHSNNENFSNEKSLITLNSSCCYIDSIFKKNNNYCIIVDFIYILNGKAAINAAKEEGNAQFEVNEKGDTTYTVWDDYYIVNKNPQKTSLLVSDRAEISLVVYNPNPLNISYQRITDIIKMKYGYKDIPFMIDAENGIVTKITEIYVP